MLNSVRPQPISSRSSSGSDAISPHTDTGMPWRTRAAADLTQQAQHRRVQRLVAIGHALVGAIDRQRVLDQIVGADGEEVDFAREQRRGERRRRHFDHDADRHVGAVDAARLELGARLVEQRPRRAHFLHRRHEREHDPQRAVRRRAQQRAQLRLEDRRLRQAEADAAQPGVAASRS